MGTYIGGAPPPFPYNAGAAACFSGVDAETIRFVLIRLGTVLGAVVALVITLLIEVVITILGIDLVPIVSLPVRLAILVGGTALGGLFGNLTARAFLRLSSCGCAPPAYAFCFCIYRRVFLGRTILVSPPVPCPGSCTLVPPAERC
jgi:hypothetical protein